MSNLTTVPRKRRPKKEIGEGTLSHLAILFQEIFEEKLNERRKKNNFTHGHIVVMRKTRFRFISLCSSLAISLSFLSVFVTSKSYIYITPNEVAPRQKLAPQIADENRSTEHACDPIYENIESGNIVPCDDNKFTIYVNYDFIKCGKSSVRLLEPDVTLNSNDECDDERTDVNDSDDNDEENSSKTMSKMIQCQQISMYIGEKNLRISRLMKEISLLSALNVNALSTISRKK